MNLNSPSPSQNNFWEDIPGHTLTYSYQYKQKLTTWWVISKAKCSCGWEYTQSHDNLKLTALTQAVRLHLAKQFSLPALDMLIQVAKVEYQQHKSPSPL